MSCFTASLACRVWVCVGRPSLRGHLQYAHAYKYCCSYSTTHWSAGCCGPAVMANETHCCCWHLGCCCCCIDIHLSLLLTGVRLDGRYRCIYLLGHTIWRKKIKIKARLRAIFMPAMIFAFSRLRNDIRAYLRKYCEE